MSETITLFVRDGFELAVMVALPVLAAAAGASLAAGLASGALGLQDGAAVALARLAGAVIGIGLVLASAGDRLVDYTSAAYEQMAAVGRREVEVASPPGATR